MPSLHRQRFPRRRSRHVPACQRQRRISVEQLEHRVVTGEWLVPAGALVFAAGAELAAAPCAERRPGGSGELTAEYRAVDGIQPLPAESAPPGTSRPSDRECSWPEKAGGARGDSPSSGKAAEELSPDERATTRPPDTRAHRPAPSAGAVYPLALFAPARSPQPGPYRLPPPAARHGQPHDHFAGSAMERGPASLALFQQAAEGSEPKGRPTTEGGKSAGERSDAASAAVDGLPASQLDPYSSYDVAGGIAGLPHTARQEIRAGYAWTWDAAGPLVQEVPNDEIAGFRYDVTDQLTAVTGWWSESYQYDALGDRTMPGYLTGPGSRLLSDGTFDYTYDHEGNLLAKTEIAGGTTTEYTWDYRNRLTGVLTRDAAGNVVQESRFTYDPRDKRIGVSVDPDGEGPAAATQTWTVYDGANPFADFDGQGRLTKQYLYGDVVDMALARLDTAGELVWYLADHLETVRDLAGVSGSVLNHVCYDSYGRVLSETDPAVGDRFRFTGREYDSETGLYYYRVRYYDPASGQFVSEDPIDFAAGDANIFRYVFNAPTGRTDPTGLAAAPPPASRPQRPGGQPSGQVLQDPRSVSPAADAIGELVEYNAAVWKMILSPRSIFWRARGAAGNLWRAAKGVDKARGAGRAAADELYRSSFPDGHAPPEGTFKLRTDSGGQLE